MTSVTFNSLNDFFIFISTLPRNNSGCILWPSTYRPVIRIRINNKQYSPSRLIVEQRLGRNLTHNHFAHHKCLNELCMNSEHIVEISRGDHNFLHDMIKHGTPLNIVNELLGYTFR